MGTIRSQNFIDISKTGEYNRIKGYYHVAPVYNASVEDLITYSGELKRRGLLKHRLGDLDSPSTTDFIAMVKRLGSGMFIVVESATKKIVGEALFEGFSGLSARGHFSVHPDYFEESHFFGSLILNTVFSLQRPDSELPWIYTIVGVQPVTNRLARRFTENIGLKTVAIIPMAHWVHHRKAFDDMRILTITNPFVELEDGIRWKF